MKSIFRHIQKLCPLSWKSTMIFSGIILAASLICFLLKTVSTSDVHVPMIFVTAVLLISLMTDGYFYGILAAIISVFGVNWAFTYPYFRLNFSITGYPLTFITMLAVGLVSSTLMTRLKLQESIRMSSEKESVRANLLRSVSHDFRTPLTSISGAISAVLEDDGRLSEQDKRELLGNAGKDVEWLYRLVENLLSVTRINGVNARLTQNEYKIVSLLSRYAGKVLTYDFIMKELWGPQSKGGNQILRVNMANIRRKIEANPAEPVYIFTEVGVGFRMIEND